MPHQGCRQGSRQQTIYNPPIVPRQAGRYQSGFTLLELMVAMSIFAMLAVAGWQVFDSVSRARERAQTQADALAELQFAYLQLQQDMAQLVPYQALKSTETAPALPATPQASVPAEPYLRLSSDTLSVVRFADPDPRYAASNSIQRVDYVIRNQQLIRRQYPRLGRTDEPSSESGVSDVVSLDSIILADISEASWQAYLPQPSDQFPDEQLDSAQTGGQDSDQGGQQTDIKRQPELLPQGIGIRFTYQGVPLSWQFAMV